MLGAFSLGFPHFNGMYRLGWSHNPAVPHRCHVILLLLRRSTQVCSPNDIVFVTFGIAVPFGSLGEVPCLAARVPDIVYVEPPWPNGMLVISCKD